MRATTNAVDRFFYGMNYSILRPKAGIHSFSGFSSLSESPTQ